MWRVLVPHSPRLGELQLTHTLMPILFQNGMVVTHRVPEAPVGNFVLSIGIDRIEDSSMDAPSVSLG